MESPDAALPVAPKEITEEQVCRDLYLLKLLEDPPTLIAFGNTAAASLAGLPTLGTIQEWATKNNLAVHHYGFGCFGIKVRGEEVASFDAGGAMLNTDSLDRKGVSYTHINFRSVDVRRSWLQYLCSGCPGHVEIALKASHQRRASRKLELQKKVGVLTGQERELVHRTSLEHSQGHVDVVRRGPGAYAVDCVCGWSALGKTTRTANGLALDHRSAARDQLSKDTTELEMVRGMLAGYRTRLNELDQPGDDLLPK